MLEEFLKTAGQIAAATGPVLMVIAIWGFVTNRVVSAQTLRERDVAYASAIAERDKQIGKWEERYDKLQMMTSRAYDITDRTAVVAAKTAGVITP